MLISVSPRRAFFGAGLRFAGFIFFGAVFAPFTSVLFGAVFAAPAAVRFGAGFAALALCRFGAAAAGAFFALDAPVARRAGVLEDGEAAPPRFAAVKLIEGDEALEKKINLPEDDRHVLEHIVDEMEQELGTDREAATADMRYGGLARGGACWKKTYGRS